MSSTYSDCGRNKVLSAVILQSNHWICKPKVKYAMWIESKVLNEREKCIDLLNQLLLDIYSQLPTTTDADHSASSIPEKHNTNLKTPGQLYQYDLEQLNIWKNKLGKRVIRMGETLAIKLKRRDALRRQRDARCDVVSFLLRKKVQCNPAMTEMRFSLEPTRPGTSSGFSQWHSAMKMVTQLPEGIPVEFRRRMWLSLAEKHLDAHKIDWHRVQSECFSEWSQKSDSELGVQIIKDLHRTGCSLFCGKDGQQNQALLKRVLLAYARWNKAVGYCQGFNMLAALILQVTEKNESDALKLMIYLIEGVLPDSYFADSLRGLSVDMVVFRELLRTKLPKLSRHLDKLQSTTKDGSTSYEPPLTNVFTMQWFLTLFCNCLPQPTVLRVWDLIMLEGNDVLLRTALAIWQTFADRIMCVRSADEFYSVMGLLMRQVLEDDLIDANSLIDKIVQIGPLHELRALREHYLYNITPWNNGPKMDRRPSGKRKVEVQPKDKMLLDIGILKKQYAKLKQRQRQAHVIFNSAVTGNRQSKPVAMNHLLVGKSALVPAKKPAGPPKGAIPPRMQHNKKNVKQDVVVRKQYVSSSSSSSDTELCDEPEEDDNEDLQELELDSNKQDNPVDIDQQQYTSSESVIEGATATDEDKVPDLLKFDAPQEDIFDTTTNGDLDFFKFELAPVEKVERSNSLPSDDGFDFEKFLQERMQVIDNDTKRCSSSEESLEELKETTQTRRSSVRALEIIQENSLILHRILQCQSRLTPTPPPPEIDDIDDIEITKSDLEYSKDFEDAPTTNQLEHSKITSDSQKILLENYDLLRSFSNRQEKEKEKIAEDDKKECGDQSLIEIDKNSKYNSILEYSRNLDEKFNNLIVKGSKSMLKTNYSFDLPSSGANEENFGARASKSYSDYSIQENKEEDQDAEATMEKDTPDSPKMTKNVGPFPVSISSRQNKDVAIRLGLYKK